MRSKRAQSNGAGLTRAVRKAMAAERRSRTLQLKLAGATHYQIAEALGITKGRVSQILKKELEQLALSTREHALRYRSEEVARLDALQRKAWPLAMGGRDKDGNLLPPDGKWFERVLSCIELRSRLLGLLSPQSVVFAQHDDAENLVFYLPDNGRREPAPDWSDDAAPIDADEPLEQTSLDLSVG